MLYLPLILLLIFYIFLNRNQTNILAWGILEVEDSMWQKCFFGVWLFHGSHSKIIHSVAKILRFIPFPRTHTSLHQIHITKAICVANLREEMMWLAQMYSWLSWSKPCQPIDRLQIRTHLWIYWLKAMWFFVCFCLFSLFSFSLSSSFFPFFFSPFPFPSFHLAFFFFHLAFSSFSSIFFSPFSLIYCYIFFLQNENMQSMNQ